MGISCLVPTQTQKLTVGSEDMMRLCRWYPLDVLRLTSCAETLDSSLKRVGHKLISQGYTAVAVDLELIRDLEAENIRESSKHASF